MTLALLTSALLFTSSVNAFWRLPCAKPVLNARVDPIVSPGRASSHLHTIMGSNAIGFNTTFEDLRNSECTTCKVKDDKSAYWIPELYYQYKNGSFSAVSHGGMLVYYLQRSAPSETIQAFPDGLRMLAGDPYVRSDTGTPESRAMSWRCLGPQGSIGDQTSGIHNTNCPWGLRAQVFFPGCWDGKNLDSPDHKSHMAYPDGIDNGKCPPTHPVHLVSIFYEVYFSVDPFNSLRDGGRFVLSNGDPTGYGLHGDFMNGWDRSVLERAVETCTNLSGVIEDCPVFKNENRFEDDSTMQLCAAKNPIPAEEGMGDGLVLDHLPGCVAVTNGPENATPKDIVPGCVPGSPAVSPSSALKSTSATMSNSNPSPSSVAAPMSNSGTPMSMAAPMSNSGMPMSVTPTSNQPSSPLTGLNRAIATPGGLSSPSPDLSSASAPTSVPSHTPCSHTVASASPPVNTISSSMSDPLSQTTSSPAPPASSSNPFNSDSNDGDDDDDDDCDMSSDVSSNIPPSSTLSEPSPQTTSSASQSAPSSPDNGSDDGDDVCGMSSGVSASIPPTGSASIPPSASPSQTSSLAGAGRRHHAQRMRRSRHSF
ncbi:hypothetical protein BGW80DRAFT_456878 [Lactifluus volemus]|nr:hypothetical protein BGW80DRAFT_456878 [Lactifluus volemus]